MVLGSAVVLASIDNNVHAPHIVPSVASMRLLVIEDHAPLVANLFSYFEARGALLDAAPDGLVGLHLAMANDYDVVVLDWMLPRLEGPAVLKSLRAQGCSVPVLMLTARDQLPDKLVGFRAGADDYLTKPFDLAELEARLAALVLRARGRPAGRVLSVGDLTLDLATLEARRGDQPLHLFPASRRLLRKLMEASPAAVSRRELEFTLWGDEPPDGDALRSHIYELRRSVDADYAVKLIHTLPRVGYRLAMPDVPRPD